MSKFNLIDNVTEEIINILQSDYDYYLNIFNDYDFNKSEYDNNRLFINTIIPHVKELIKRGINYNNSNIGYSNYYMIISLLDDFLLDDSINQSHFIKHLTSKIKHDILIRKSINQNGDDTPLYSYQY